MESIRNSNLIVWRQNRQCPVFMLNQTTFILQLVAQVGPRGSCSPWQETRRVLNRSHQHMNKIHIQTIMIIVGDDVFSGLRKSLAVLLLFTWLQTCDGVGVCIWYIYIFLTTRCLLSPEVTPHGPYTLTRSVPDAFGYINAVYNSIKVTVALRENSTDVSNWTFSEKPTQ